MPFTVQSFISAPREPVFDYIADLAARVAFSDHYLKNFHLARAKSTGRGAAATFRLDAPFFHCWGELWIDEVERPRRIVEQGRLGRVGRTHMWSVYELWPEGQQLTRVDLTTWTEPGTRLDAVRQALGMRPWWRRQNRAALEQLRRIFEQEPARPYARASIAGFEPHKAPRFGASMPRAQKP